MKKLKGAVRILTETEYNFHSKINKEAKIDLLLFSYPNDILNWKIIEECLENLECDGRDITYKYNNNGKLIEECIYRVNGRFVSKSRYHYDKNGFINTKSDYNFRDVLEFETIYECNDNGNIIKEIFLPFEKAGRYITYKYNNNGILVKKNDFGYRSKLIFCTIYKYDDNGNMIENYRIDHFERLISKSTYSYNEYGKIIEKCIHTINGKFVSKDTYKFVEFDGMGNWLNRIMYVDDEPISLTKRVINYY
ncbi:MAG: hypothetical protein HQ521_06335 [Bacteroidetes bacterium]|nr:hypothetical protein [Bacteroidota bacterium]